MSSARSLLDEVRRPALLIGLSAFWLGAVACRKTGPAGVAAPLDPTPAASARALEALTLGAPVKLVWLEGTRMVGFDSGMPGEPVVLREGSDLQRPLMAPDGAAVVFSEQAKIHAVTWVTREDRVLTDGWAVATWRDPATREDWVYAAEAGHTERLFRFPLHQPTLREPVWDSAPVDPGTVQVSRDGQRFSGRFYDHDGGVADVGRHRWEKLSGPRPLALAPDASHLSAMLDGTGRRLHFFHPSAEAWDPAGETLVPPAAWRAVLPPETFADGVRFEDMRWSNHPRFLVLSAALPSRGRLALALLSGNAHAIEGIATVAAKGAAVSQPDAWVAGGESARLEGWPDSPEPYILPDQAADGSWLRWPTTDDGVSFRWGTDREINLLPGRPAPCRLTPRGWGRFGQWGDALLDGGTFEADMASARHLAEACARTNAFTIEFLLTESTEKEGPNSNRLIALQLDRDRDAFSLSRVDQTLVLRALLDPGDGTPAREYQSLITPVAIQPNRPLHLVVEVANGQVTWTLDGEPVGDSQVLGPPSLSGWKPEEVQRLVIGDADPKGDVGWRGRIEKIMLLNRGVTSLEVRDDRANARSRSTRLNGRLSRVRATLTHTTDFPPPTAGGRCLVQQLYQVQEVLSGKVETTTLPVWHWAVLDGQAVPSRPSTIGSAYELLISPIERHQELEIEDVFLGSTGWQPSAFLDVARPSSPPTPVTPIATDTHATPR